MRKLKKSTLLLGLMMILAASRLEAQTVSLLQEALDELAGSHYASGMSTLLGNFTWEDTGIGTEFSGYLRQQAALALTASDYYSLVKSSGPVFNSPEAALLMGPDERAGAGYLTWGSFRSEGSAIYVDLEVFSFIFNQTVGRKTVKLPLKKPPCFIRWTRRWVIFFPGAASTSM
jgi:hypothetical protein